MGVSKSADIALSWLLFVFYAFRAIAYTVAEIAAASYNFLIQFFLGAAGKIFIFFMLLSVLGAVNTKTQADVDSSIATAYVKTERSRVLVYDSIQLVVPLAEPMICLSNLISSWSSVTLQSFLRYVFECGNLKMFLLDLKDFVSVVLESSLKFLFLEDGPFGNAFDFQSIFKAFVKLQTNFDPVAECLCADLLPVYNFTREIISEDNLGCLINQSINSVIQLWQELFKTVLFIVEAVVTLGQGVADNPYEPQLLYFDTLCLASECGANWIDFILGKFLGFFVEEPPQIGLGCVAGELACTGLSLVKLVLLNVVGLFWNTKVWNPFLDSNYSSTILHMNNTGKCVQTLITPIDSCLGEAAGNAVRFPADVLNFFVVLVQQGKFELDPVRQSLNRFLGQSTFGPGSHVGLIGSHEKSRKQNQTSFTCMVARLSAFTTASDPDFEKCNVAIADLTNSIGQLFLLPFDFIGEAISNKDYLVKITGNPLASKSRGDFETYFTILFDAITDRVFGLADYLAHLFGCVPDLKAFGKGLVLLVSNIRTVWTDIQDILILAIELVLQTIIVIITLFAGPIFNKDTFGNELSIFGEIILNVFLKLLELILDIVERIINFTIAFFFPALFGQETLYEDPNAPATFTACVSNFVPDCICGLVYQLTKDICLPLDLGCLGDLLPGCGIFQTNPTDIVTSTNPQVVTTWYTQSNRKRSYSTWDEREVVNMTDKYDTIFEYFAGEFNSGFCGDVFMRYKNYNPVSGPSIGEIDAAILMGCIGFVKSSVIYAAESGDRVHPRYLMDSGRVFNTSRDFIKGATIASLTGITNFGKFSRTPEPAIGKISLSKPIYVSVEEQLNKQNISDPMAVSYLKAITDITSVGYETLVNTFENSTQIDRNGTLHAIYSLGSIGKQGLGLMFAAGKIISTEVMSDDVTTQLSTGFTSFTSTITSSIDWAAVEASLAPQTKKKRHHDEGLRAPWFPNATADNETAIDDEARGITKADIAYYHATKARRAAQAYGGLLAGPYLEALSQRNMKEAETKGMTLLKFGQPKYEINKGPYEHVAPYHRIEERGFYAYANVNRKRGVFSEENAMNVPGEHLYLNIENPDIHTNVSYIYGTDGLIDFEDHIPNSCGKLHMFCDGPLLTGCDSIEYIETLGLCQPFFGNRGVVIECGDGFAGLAIYPDSACKGVPRVVTTNSSIPGADRGCITFAVKPNGPKNNFFCIRSDECTACPVDKVIPNFECAYVDEVVHRMKWLTQRCLVKFIGAIKPPFNFTNIIPQPTDPFLFEFSGNRSTATSTIEEQTNTTCVRSKCGDGIISDEIYRIYTNQTHYIERRCEQCDDNNRRSYDGCTSSCQLEKCPTLIYFADSCKPPYYTLGQPQRITKAPTPKFCLYVPVFNGALQMNCKAFDPVIFAFSNTNCHPPIGNTYYVYNDTCGSSAPSFIMNSKEALCGQNCDVCGDGIVTGDEACDENPWRGTSCFACRFIAKPCNTSFQTCTGACRGGSLDNTLCEITPLSNRCADAGGICMIQYTNPPTLPENPDFYCATVKCSRTVRSGLEVVEEKFNETVVGLCTTSIQPGDNILIGSLTGFFYYLDQLAIFDNARVRVDCDANNLLKFPLGTETQYTIPLPIDNQFRLYPSQTITSLNTIPLNLIPEWACETINLNHSCPTNFTNPLLSRKRSVGTSPMIGNQTLEERLSLLSKISTIQFLQSRRYILSKRSVEVPVDAPTVVNRTVVQPQLSVKEAWMETWYYDKFHEVYNFFTGSTGNTLDSKVEKVKDFFTNTNLDPYPGDHGIWFYVTFPFICHNPENLDSSQGVGLLEALVVTITYFVVILIILSFTNEFFAAVFGQAAMIWGLQIFLGLAFGYSVKCLASTPPKIPEKLVEEIGNLAGVFNKTCIGFMEPVMTTPCIPDEEQIALACKSIGFVDGFDTIVALVEFYFPAKASQWIRNSTTVSQIRTGISFVSWFNGYPLLESYDQSLENIDLGGADPTPLQKYCFWRTLPMIAEPFPFLFLGGFLTISFIGVYRVLAESVFWMIFGGTRAIAAMWGSDDFNEEEMHETILAEQRHAMHQQTYVPKPKET